MSDSSRKAAPNTRAASVSLGATTKSPSSKQLPTEIKNAIAKMRASPNAAADYLRHLQLIPEDEQVSMDALTTGLVHFAALPNTKFGVWVIEAICAFAQYAQQVHANDLAETLWKKIQPAIVIRNGQQEDLEDLQQRREE